jgi:hypothetical protein
MLLLGWSHCYKNYKAVITIWLTDYSIGKVKVPTTFVVEFCFIYPSSVVKVMVQVRSRLWLSVTAFFAWFSGQSLDSDAKATQTRLCCSLVEAIATKIIRPSSQSGWLSGNIHISNDNESFTCYIDVSFPLSMPRLLPE